MFVKFPTLGRSNQARSGEKPNPFTYLKTTEGKESVRPAVVILGFVLGSAAAISFALAGTVIVFALLRSEHPRLDAEIGPLLTNTGLFVLLSSAAAASFYGELKQRSWRRLAQLGLAAMLIAVGVYLSLG
jgi:hypothetical protein